MGGSNSGGGNSKDPLELKATGGWRRSRHVGLGRPAIEIPNEVSQMEVPGKLGAIGRREFYRMAKLMLSMNTLAISDSAVIYQYSRMFEQIEVVIPKRITTLEHLRNPLQQSGRSKRKDVTAAGIRLAVAQMERIESQISALQKEIFRGRVAIRHYLTELGMTPASRHRVKVLDKPEKPSSKLLAFRGGKATGGKNDSD
jgi:hypothetical protein